MKIRAAFVFVAFVVLSGAAPYVQSQTSEDEVIKVSTSLVNIPVIVSDRNGRNIAGLNVGNFDVFQDGEKQKIEYFASEETPINVAILLDTSKSTQGVLGKIKKAAREFIKQLRPNDKAMIVTFDNNVEFLSDLTVDKKKLKNAIDDAKIGELAGTVLHDAVFDVVNQQFAAIKGRKAMILLTDGKDFGSGINRRELIHRMEESDTMIYSVFYKTEEPKLRPQRRQEPVFDPFPRNGRFPNRNRFPRTNPRQQRPNNPNIERARQRVERNNQEAVSFLTSLADVTAGRVFEKEIKDLDETFAMIADELRKQYLIGYYPEQDADAGSLHQIRVRTNVQNAVVRSKTTYRAQSPGQ